MTSDNKIWIHIVQCAAQITFVTFIGIYFIEANI
jgi:hypothetical protein